MPEPKSMWVFTEEPVEPPPGERPLEPRLERAGRGVNRVEIPFGSLQSSMRDFLDGAHGLLAQELARADPYAVDTVEVAAQISADGKVGFLGTGVGVGGQASVKFIFKRQDAE